MKSNMENDMETELQSGFVCGYMRVVEITAPFSVPVVSVLGTVGLALTVHHLVVLIVANHLLLLIVQLLGIPTTSSFVFSSNDTRIPKPSILNP